jgi:hypothetical protein
MEQELKNEILNKNLLDIKNTFIQKHKKMIAIAITAVLFVPLAVISLNVLPNFTNINQSNIEQIQQQVIDKTELKLSFNNFEVKDINKMIGLIQEDSYNFKLYQQAKKDFNDGQIKTDIATFVDLTTMFSPNGQPKDINQVKSGLVIIDQYISAIGIYIFENRFKLTDEEEENYDTIMDNLMKAKNTGLKQLDSLSTSIEQKSQSHKM